MSLSAKGESDADRLVIGPLTSSRHFAAAVPGWLGWMFVRQGAETIHLSHWGATEALATVGRQFNETLRSERTPAELLAPIGTPLPHRGDAEEVVGFASSDLALIALGSEPRFYQRLAVVVRLAETLAPGPSIAEDLKALLAADDLAAIEAAKSVAAVIGDRVGHEERHLDRGPVGGAVRALAEVISGIGGRAPSPPRAVFDLANRLGLRNRELTLIVALIARLSHPRS